MSKSAVLVVGAGALGQNTAMNLALAGIGEIRIVDRDRFEEHNRTRSPAYPLPEEQERFGMGKARAVASKLRRMMTAPQPVMRYAENWIQELGDGAFQGVSAVVSCVDSQLARAYLSDKTRQHGLLFIEGGFEAERLTLTTFPAATGEEARTTPCWRCSNPSVRGSFSCRNYAARAEAIGIIPAIQNTAAVLGGLQAEAAIIALQSRHEAIQDARGFSLNIRTWEGRTVKLATDSKCPGVHRSLEAEPIQLQTTADETVEQLLREMGEHLGAAARLWLPMKTYAKLFWNAPCTTKCGRMAAVRSPEWRWMMDPRCSVCGGPFPAINNNALSSPYTPPELTLRSEPEVLRATCRQIGLPPLCLVGAGSENSASAFFDTDAPPALFKLPGALDELYQSGETQ
jgi:molybdopterin/thiamine biosynthesis adenylyltransferase